MESGDGASFTFEYGHLVPQAGQEVSAESEQLQLLAYHRIGPLLSSNRKYEPFSCDVHETASCMAQKPVYFPIPSYSLTTARYTKSNKVCLSI
jgi:hypothetical protein